MLDVSPNEPGAHVPGSSAPEGASARPHTRGPKPEPSRGPSPGTGGSEGDGGTDSIHGNDSK
jgi:hypothetical protein